MKDKLLVDTRPLVEFLFWQCSQKLGRKFLQVGKESEVLKTEEPVKRFVAFLKKYQLFIASVVIAEIQCHQRRKVKGFHQQRAFWKLTLDQLYRVFLFQEQHKPLSDIKDVSLIQQFGPVDAIQISIAQEEQMMLLSSDTELLSYCDSQKIQYKNFADFKY
jgi:rRNA-processing protein FCF1